MVECRCWKMVAFFLHVTTITLFDVRNCKGIKSIIPLVFGFVTSLLEETGKLSGVG